MQEMIIYISLINDVQVSKSELIYRTHISTATFSERFDKLIPYKCSCLLLKMANGYLYDVTVRNGKEINNRDVIHGG